MKGRGYIGGGLDSAAAYISEKFQQARLLPFGGETYEQPHTMSVNTFPGNVMCRLNGSLLEPAVDFVPHAAMPEIHSVSNRFQIVDVGSVKNRRDWRRIRREIPRNKTVVLENSDALFRNTQVTPRKLAYQLKKGVYIITVKDRLRWLACSKLSRAKVMFVMDSVMPKTMTSLEVNIESKFIKSFPAKNLVGYIPGTDKQDSVIVFTAHYDHLGMLGSDKIFPGANDNASGVAILLYLANYYAAHPAKYSVAFIAFSGEEPGLKGSKYFVGHPLFPLKKIRFLVNLDIVGDATHGITVVNAPAHPVEFSLLERINAGHNNLDTNSNVNQIFVNNNHPKGTCIYQFPVVKTNSYSVRNSDRYVPAVLSRDQTKNSDHYPFSKKGVPAFYIYANGAKPFYHDIFDRANEVNFENIDNLIRLLQIFVSGLCE
jgi:aminopeptidase YwaD